MFNKIVNFIDRIFERIKFFKYLSNGRVYEIRYIGGKIIINRLKD